MVSNKILPFLAESFLRVSLLNFGNTLKNKICELSVRPYIYLTAHNNHESLSAVINVHVSIRVFIKFHRFTHTHLISMLTRARNKVTRKFQTCESRSD